MRKKYISTLTDAHTVVIMNCHALTTKSRCTFNRSCTFATFTTYVKNINIIHWNPFSSCILDVPQSVFCTSPHHTPLCCKWQTHNSFCSFYNMTPEKKLLELTMYLKSNVQAITLLKVTFGPPYVCQNFMRSKLPSKNKKNISEQTVESMHYCN